jgi:hypothetical protein
MPVRIETGAWQAGQLTFGSNSRRWTIGGDDARGRVNGA